MIFYQLIGFNYYHYMVEMPRLDMNTLSSFLFQFSFDLHLLFRVLISSTLKEGEEKLRTEVDEETMDHTYDPMRFGKTKASSVQDKLDGMPRLGMNTLSSFLFQSSFDLYLLFIANFINVRRSRKRNAGIALNPGNSSG